ncbi:phenylalanyl-tRNA synthetase, beta subunit [Parvularcula bermudensis HTCC2503]|uniref:Phenylalanine--tRNA ligase beta subunit n=1 Tax=Parvularcula bermudensis (strain ATCC BAA-594 / HTCC2503 / KCTC 12087) TaxID=314260 RepID=E0TF59_PARBH|nr:phenylalanine--tRNA ligase subunit beta [Parvularcula bermudensis]ADM08977.1 phenylalanyl-tRNA synthetase, beta subunit [Parvularcula bermudensis HTCC2503]
MKFTLSWLKRHLETDASIDEIADMMVRIGLEVEDISNPADALSAMSVGHILRAERHPDADKLQVCTVATKDGEKQIVCGAPNARADLKVAYAPVGAYVPGIDVTLTKAKIRGVESFGMLCSASELEISDEHAGIMELPAAAAVGTPLADLLDIDDPVIDFEVTPNRPDTNGVDGVARDLAAAGLGKLITPTPVPTDGHFPCPIAIEIDDEEACPAFLGRVIRNVKNGPSPAWLQAQLKAIGLRPINALVDVTNFLSYDRARPLHVYDTSALMGTVRARRGREGESFLALDGKTYSVDADMTVIADDEKVLGLGGVMGGEASGCTEETTSVLIESALFDPLITARTGRRTGIVSDARYRFERGVDPAGVESGMDLAVQMILEICGGEVSDPLLAGSLETAREAITFPPNEVERLTGLDVTEGEKEDILLALGFEVSRGGTWEVTPPTWRPDIMGKADLVEEIARIHGFDDLPTLPLPPMPSKRQLDRPRWLETMARAGFAEAGYLETISWAFCEDQAARLFGGETAPKLSNPISSDLGRMRPSPLPGLLAAVQRNAAYGAREVRLFEVGAGYPGDAPEDQMLIAAAVQWGAGAKTWQRPPREPSVFDAKALALEILGRLGAPVDNLMTFAEGPPHYHPGRKGRLSLGPKTTLAHFGELHPTVLKALDVSGPVIAVELYPHALPPSKAKGPSRPARQTSKLMPLRRDFAFVVDKAIAADTLLKAVRGADKALISEVHLFDIYEGDGLPADRKSLAVTVTIQPKEASLDEAAINALSAKIVAQAEKAVGATLRG